MRATKRGRWVLKENARAHERDREEMVREVRGGGQRNTFLHRKRTVRITSEPPLDAAR